MADGVACRDHDDVTPKSKPTPDFREPTPWEMRVWKAQDIIGGIVVVVGIALAAIIGIALIVGALQSPPTYHCDPLGIQCGPSGPTYGDVDSEWQARDDLAYGNTGMDYHP
jgi:hypothetical protein